MPNMQKSVGKIQSVEMSNEAKGARKKEIKWENKRGKIKGERWVRFTEILRVTMKGKVEG